MAIIGIAGCTGLLLTGLGLQNAINDIIDKQYGELVPLQRHRDAWIPMLPMPKQNAVAELLCEADSEESKSMGAYREQTLCALRARRMISTFNASELNVPARYAANSATSTPLRTRVGHKPLVD